MIATNAIHFTPS